MVDSIEAVLVKNSDDVSPLDNSPSNFEEGDAEGINMDEEAKKLGLHPPLKTLLKLSIGPLIAQTVNSLYGIVDSTYVSKMHGTDGLTVLMLANTVNFIHIALGNFFMVAVSSRLSFLYGQKEPEKCSQVLVDILRFALIFGALLPAILLPAAKPWVRWFGASEKLADATFHYLAIHIGCSANEYTYMALCGLLQAEGRSLLFGAAQFASCALNVGLFEPLYLLGVKTGVWGAALASVCSMTVPMLVLYTLAFCGKFTVRPHFRMFLLPFSRDSFAALRVSLSALITSLTISIPQLVLGKYISLASTAVGEYEATMSAWNVLNRLYTFVICVCSAVQQGFLPAASYAFGSKRLRRLYKLALHGLWIGTLWSFVVSMVIVAFPKQVASIFDKEPLYLKVAGPMLILGFVSCGLNMVQFIVTSTLQAMMKVVLSVVMSFMTTILPLPIFGTALYLTNKRNAVRIVAAFIGNDIVSAAAVVIVAIWKLGFLRKAQHSEFSESGKSDKSEKSEKSDRGERANGVHANEINEAIEVNEAIEMDRSIERIETIETLEKSDESELAETRDAIENVPKGKADEDIRANLL